jgi:hypothetical protein
MIVMAASKFAQVGMAEDLATVTLVVVMTNISRKGSNIEDIVGSSHRRRRQEGWWGDKGWNWGESRSGSRR